MYMACIWKAPKRGLDIFDANYDAAYWLFDNAGKFPSQIPLTYENVYFYSVLLRENSVELWSPADGDFFIIRSRSFYLIYLRTHASIFPFFFQFSVSSILCS
jgi:hypothetical protein